MTPSNKERLTILKEQSICKKCGHDNSQYIIMAPEGPMLLANYCTECGNKLHDKCNCCNHQLS